MPMRLLGNLIVTGIALWLTALILPGMHLGQDAAPVLTQILTIAVIALILSVINAIIRPILSLLAKIGRASCRESVCIWVVGIAGERKKIKNKEDVIGVMSEN